VLELEVTLQQGTEPQDAEAEAQADRRRRLEEEKSGDAFGLDKMKRYKHGIDKLLETWLHNEDLTYNMCPEVYRLQVISGTFSKRLQMWLDGGATMGIITGVNAGAIVVSKEDARLDSKDKCPSKDYVNVGPKRMQLTFRQRFIGIFQWFVTISVAGVMMAMCRCSCRPKEGKSEQGYSRALPGPLNK